MCRWFAYIGREPQLLEDILLRPRHSLIKQVDEHFLPAKHVCSPTPADISNAANDKSTSLAFGIPSTANDYGSPNPLTNMDGFGVAWWTSNYCLFEGFRKEHTTTTDAAPETPRQHEQLFRPVTYRSIRPPLHDRVLASLASGISSPCVVAHIRATTGSLAPVVETNCHPFTFGRHVFAHNGILGGFAHFRIALLSALPLRYRNAVMGTTDAEHVAALYFLELCGRDGDWEALYPADEMAAAMGRTIGSLRRLRQKAEDEAEAEEIVERHRVGGEREPTTLNLVACSGSSMVAVRYGEDCEAPSLYYSTVAGATMNRKYKGHPDDQTDTQDDEGSPPGIDKSRHAAHVIVASEPSTLNDTEWELLPAGYMVVVEHDIKWEMTKLKVV